MIPQRSSVFLFVKKSYEVGTFLSAYVKGHLCNDPWQNGTQDYTYYDIHAGNYDTYLLSALDNEKNGTANWCTISGNTWTGTARTTSNVKTLTFNFNLSANPYGWPTANNVDEQTWSMPDEDTGISYEFARHGGYLSSNSSGYYFVLQGRYLGFPAIPGWSLQRAIVTLGNGASTRNFAISSTDTLDGTSYAPTYVPGGSLLGIPASQTGPFMRYVFDAQPDTRYWGFGNTLVIKELKLTYVEESNS